MATVKAITLKTFDSFCPGLQAPVFGIGKTAYLLNVCHPLLTTTSDHILDNSMRAQWNPMPMKLRVMKQRDVTYQQTST
jgi:hypothetical protein